MAVIDDEGRLFGTINVVDVLVVLFALAVVVAGAALLTTGGNEPTEQPTRTVVFETDAQPDYVVEAISEGPVPASGVVAVENKTIRPAEGNTTGERLRLTVILVVSENGDGLPTFADDRLYIGRTLRLDFGSTIVSGTVVDVRE